MIALSPFLRFAFGNRAFSRRIVSMVLPTLRCMGKQMTRDELKRNAHYNFSLLVLRKSGCLLKQNSVSSYWHRLMRPAGLIAVAE